MYHQTGRESVEGLIEIEAGDRGRNKLFDGALDVCRCVGARMECVDVQQAQLLDFKVAGPGLFFLAGMPSGSDRGLRVSPAKVEAGEPESRKMHEYPI